MMTLFGIDVMSCTFSIWNKLDMRIKNVNVVEGHRKVMDSCVINGYSKTFHGSLADVDNDFSADRREEVKAYLERRYNKDGLQRVFSAGTFTTAKIKSAIKDVARTHRVPVPTTNYLTAILEDDMSWTDLMRLAATDKRIRDFIQKYPNVFEEMLPIMGQARSAGMHASALIITPEYVKGERVECFDLLPIRKMGDLLVSEISGVDIDAIGILKNDVLGIRELTRLSDIIKMIYDEYGVKYTILDIATKYLNDPKVFETIKAGYTQGIFQMSGDGITKYIKRMAPDNINDIIASVALFRPGTLESGAAEDYVRAKRGEYEPSYLWGTYDILNETHAQMCYQEQISQVAQKVGNLSLGDGVNLVKALSKKKLEKVRKFKDKFFKGVKENGCPKEAAEQIWSNIEDAAKYSFNKSHATAYGLTAYVGAWFKTHYPTAFYTATLRDHDDDKMAILMNEICNVNGTELVQPDINVSGVDFTADFKNNRIYWSLSRIKWLGVKAVNYIVQERKLYGDFYDMEDFIKRIFKSKFSGWEDDGTPVSRGRCPVTARSMKNLIFAGAFDRCEHISSITERYGLIERAAEMLGFAIREKDIPEGLRDKHYFWSQQQINMSGMGSIDYRRIYDNHEKPSSLARLKFIDFKDLNNLFYEVKRGVICGTICTVTDKSYKDRQTGQTKHFGKIEIQQNTDMNILTIWDDWATLKSSLMGSAGRIVIAVVNVKWSDYDEKNVLQIGKNVFLTLV